MKLGQKSYLTKNSEFSEESEKSLEEKDKIDENMFIFKEI